MLRGLEATATTVLHSAGLAFLINLNTADDFSLREELEQRGFDWETKEGYAAQIMQAIHLLRRAEGAARTIIAIKLGTFEWQSGYAPRLGVRTESGAVSERDKYRSWLATAAAAQERFAEANLQRGAQQVQN
jgi:hypothetical protein